MVQYSTKSILSSLLNHVSVISIVTQEPRDGFQLFTVNTKVVDREGENSSSTFELGPTAESLEEDERGDVCYSLFDFNRIDLVEKFSTNFVLQGRSWYTKWVTVSPLFPVVTRYRERWSPHPWHK